MKKKFNYMFLVAILLPLLLFVFPMWRITLTAPQYPDGVTMYIWISKITGATESTLQNINILNHYIGMKHIVPDNIPELKYFPMVVIGMVCFGLILFFVRNRKAYLAWTIILVLLGILGIYDFYLWEHDYGHNLDPKAAIKIEGMTYQPPLLGSKWLLNFKADSWPYIGGIALGLSIILGFLAYYMSKNKEGHLSKNKFPALLALMIAGLSFTSCAKEKSPIVYGEDHCAHCMMTIVQPQYGAELLTKKGKVYKFDAVECLIGFLNSGEIAADMVYSKYVVPYTVPKVLHEVNNCYYLHSEKLPSPMGMNLTAFRDLSEAEKFQKQYGGDLYEWEELISAFDNLPSQK